MFLSDRTVISISLQVELTKSLTMISGLFAVMVLSVLTGMSHMMVMLLSLLCITVSGSCSYHCSYHYHYYYYYYGNGENSQCYIFQFSIILS